MVASGISFVLSPKSIAYSILLYLNSFFLIHQKNVIKNFAHAN